MTEPTPSAPTRVVIVGGGVAAIETVLALHDLAGARLSLTLIAAQPDFVMRSMAVTEPSTGGTSTVCRWRR